MSNNLGLDSLERGEISPDWNDAFAAVPDGWRVARLGEIMRGAQAGWWTVEISQVRDLKWLHKTLRHGPAALMWCAVKAGMKA